MVGIFPLFDQFDKKAVGVTRMKERTQPFSSGLGFTEDFYPGFLDRGHFSMDIVNFVTDVVETFSTLFEKFRHDALVSDRLEELDENLPYRNHADLDRPVSPDYGIGRFQLKNPAVKRPGLLEVFNGYSQMADLFDHLSSGMIWL